MCPGWGTVYEFAPRRPRVSHNACTRRLRLVKVRDVAEEGVSYRVFRAYKFDHDDPKEYEIWLKLPPAAQLAIDQPPLVGRGEVHNANLPEGDWNVHVRDVAEVLQRMDVRGFILPQEFPNFLRTVMEHLPRPDERDPMDKGT